MSGQFGLGASGSSPPPGLRAALRRLIVAVREGRAVRVADVELVRAVARA